MQTKSRPPLASALLAPLPSVLLGRYYARLAARALSEFGFAEAQACLEPIAHSFKRLVKQAALVLIGIAPVKLALDLIPVVGPALITIVAAAWGLHWVVVDAFDAARTLRPGQTLAELEALALHAPQPWFTRLPARWARKLPLLGRPLARFAAFCDRLAGGDRPPPSATRCATSASSPRAPPSGPK